MSSMAYDHPAYLTRHFRGTVISAGSGTIGRFAAHADLIAKAAHAMPNIAGTSASELIKVYKVAITGGGTTALGTITMGGSASITAGTVDLADAAIADGDEVRFLSGTDATVVYSAELEYQVTPGATLTD